MTTYKAQK